MKKKEMITVSLLTFSLFFGAGNLMFPPMLGKEAGQNMFFAMIYFSLTAIIFPILAVIAVTKFDGLKNLASRVDSKFALIFTICTYLAIGPALAIPRAGTLPFEIAIAPLIKNESIIKWALLIYTIIFFIIVYWLSLSPNKLLDRIGKVLSPIFLILVVLLFLGTFFKTVGSYLPSIPKYSTLYGVQGFLDGYLTLDTLAGLNYGLVVAYVIREKGIGINNEKEVQKIIKKTGFLAGILLFLVYISLAHIGVVSSELFPNTKNGIEILGEMSKHIFGQFGFILISLMFTIACLNIGIGLITSISQYFNQLVPKISYKKWALFWVIFSFLVANLGLSQIMNYSVPVLLSIYPSAIVLIILSFIDEKIKGSKLIYSLTIYPTIIVSIVNTLDKIKIEIPIITEIIRKLPLYSIDLGWIVVAFVFFVVGYVVKQFKKN